MNEVKQVKSAEMFPLVQEILDSGGSALIVVTGMSMYPFLAENRDKVELLKKDFQNVRRGDIVLALRNDGQYILHRIWKKKLDSFYMVGDAQTWIDGPYREEQLIAYVNKVWRNGKEIKSSAFWWNFCCSVWLVLRPFRSKILKLLQILKRVNNK